MTWATPAPIFTSTPLSATQLDATATGVTGAALPGAFVYKPAAGTTLAAGAQTLTTTFTPTDTTNYTTATAQVTIQVNSPTASTVVVQDSPNPATFGQTVTLTATVTASDGKPFFERYSDVHIGWKCGLVGHSGQRSCHGDDGFAAGGNPPDRGFLHQFVTEPAADRIDDAGDR